MLNLMTHWEFDNEAIQNRFEKRLSQKLETLQKYLNTDEHPNELRVKVEKINHIQSRVTLQLNLKYKTILADKTADDPVKALELAFDVVKETTLQHIQQNRGSNPYRKGHRRTEELAELQASLEDQEMIMSRKEFTEKLLPLLTPIRNYIRRRIRFAQIVEAVKPNLFQSQDILDDVVARAYDRLVNKPIQQSLEQWLYTLADDVLQEKLKEAEWEGANTESWEKYLEQEIEDMDEKIIVDAEGDLYVEDEFDDLDYTFEHIEVPSIQAADEKQRKSKEFRLVLKALATIPVNKRDIFDLYALDGFTLIEIANIKHMKKQEVEEIIREVKEEVQKRVKEIK